MLHKYKRPLAVFLLLTFVTNIFAPTVSLALTAGPTAPEATSFEPVDTTDMINLATGDLVYNIPLLEVPGPSGGYPLSLSYHAGIQPNVDASMCGLGWSLNPGAINRSTSGFPDDYENQAGSTRTFWEGGESSSLTIGVTFSKVGNSSVSAGLSYSEDTYKGVSTNAFIKAGDFSATYSNVNGVSSSGMSLGIGGTSVSVSRHGISASLNTGNIEQQVGQIVGLKNMDISLQTVKNAIKSSVGISIEKSSGKQGNISTNGYNYSANIPTPWGFKVQLGKSYQRYWIDETVNSSLNGAIYFPSSLPSSAELDTKAFDVYDLADISRSLTGNIPDESLAGSFIDYDSYQVLAQGVSGNMKPYHYNAYLLRQNKKEDNSKYRMKCYPLGLNKNPSFRFIGDFANRYVHDSDLDQFSSTGNSALPISFAFNDNRATGETGTDGYDEQRNVLPGSNHVEYFTNESILSGEASASNFIDCSALGFGRENNSQIGGFKITNSQGVVYHYALPVYSYDEWQYSGKVDEKGKHSSNTYNKPGKYAYSWFLTSVTGPDYVDKNLNGKADNGDYGYWVNFEYGKWSREFNWRNPSQGFNKDIDQQFENFSKGKKEIYYLNAIKTETHTALFVKGARLDGKGVVPEFNQAVLTGTDHTFRNVDDGGFDPVYNDDGSGRDRTEKYPASTLKLDRIYLLKNDDFADYPNMISAVAGHNTNGRFYSGLVIDMVDVSQEPLKSRLRENALKIIELNTDYSLCPRTANSFVSAEIDAILNPSLTPSLERKGKLTLKSLKVYGKNETSLIPEIRFNYEVDEQFNGVLNSERVSVGNEFYYVSRVKIKNGNDHNFRKGEIVRFTYNNNNFYGYVSHFNESSNEIQLVPLEDNWSQLQSNVNYNLVFHKTKNPPYNKDYYDLWGMYKVDFNPAFMSGNQAVREESENVKRMTTSVSATSTDVWSLREITTSVGAKIKISYEPDHYTAAIKSMSNIPIKDIERLPDGRTRLILYENVGEFGLAAGDQINFRALTAMRYNILNPDAVTLPRFDCNGNKYTYVYQWFYHKDYSTYKIAIDEISENALVIRYDFNSKYPDPNDHSTYSLGIYRNCNASDDCYRWTEGYQNYFERVVPVAWMESEDPVFLGGEIFTDKLFTPYGGDLRVRSISIVNNDEVRSTQYEYNHGVTTYEPVGFSVPVRRLKNITTCLENLQENAIRSYTDDYSNDIYKKFAILFANSRELPGPGVMYGQVKVREQIERAGQITKIPGWSEYHFEVFSPNQIGGTINRELNSRFRNQVQFYEASASTPSSNEVLGLQVVSTATSYRTAIEDYSAILGSLKRNTLYDEQGRKVSETVNHYLHDDFNQFKARLRNEFHDQGLTTETFADSRIIYKETVNTQDRYSLNGLISHKVRYPGIQTGQTVTNYKTGITTSSKNLSFDYYSGQVTKTQSTDGYGNTFITTITPAYRIYQNGMGLAANGGKNMLTQEAASYTYKVNPDVDPTIGLLGLVSASVQTWSDGVAVLSEGTQPGIWRKHASYSFTGDSNMPLTSDGLYPLSGVLPSFNAWNINDPTPEDWQKNGAVTLYDVYSHALEATDINGNFAATKMSMDNTKVFATVANAQYNEFAYSGAEDGADNNLGGGVKYEGQLISTSVHTGLKAIQADNGQKAFSYTTYNPQKRTYRVSVWSSQQQASIMYTVGTNAGQPAELKPVRQANGWYLLEADIKLTSDYPGLEVWCTATAGTTVFDDFRIHPKDAAMSSYVYDKWGELSHILDNNNLFTMFEYDEMGRLKEVWKETFTHGVKKTSEHVYHHANTGLGD